MVNFTVKNMPERLHRQLVERAKKNRRSLNGEIIFELQQAAGWPDVNVKKLLKETKEIKAAITFRVREKEIKNFKQLGRP